MTLVKIAIGSAMGLGLAVATIALAIRVQRRRDTEISTQGINSWFRRRL